jgi:acyl-coenzyme A synthetase/AMP-(fatty) acid ligase
MKIMPKLVLALTAFAAIGASAQTVYSGQSDQERRERNREEALANYRAGTTDTTTTRRERVREDARDAKDRVREDAHEAKDKVRHGAHKVANSTRRVAHKTANESRRVGHKIAVKARETTARADAKFGTIEKKDAKGEASNPTGLSNTAANGPKP